MGDLGRMLNTMAVRIQDLLADLHDSEDLKRKLEIRALQSQINPPFHVQYPQYDPYVRHDEGL
ncbi:sensor histidine kinase [Paenibacillus rhizoplanae]